MTWRSLGKAYDWELEKFRVISREPINNILSRCKRNTLIEETRKDFSRTSSGYGKTLLAISIGKPSNLDKPKVDLSQ